MCYCCQVTNCKFAKNFRCLYENCNDPVNIVIHLPLAKLVISILFNKFVAHYCSSSVCSSSLQIQSDETVFHVRYLIDFKDFFSINIAVSSVNNYHTLLEVPCIFTLWPFSGFIWVRDSHFCSALEIKSALFEFKWHVLPKLWMCVPSKLERMEDFQLYACFTFIIGFYTLLFACQTDVCCQTESWIDQEAKHDIICLVKLSVMETMKQGISEDNCLRVAGTGCCFRPIRLSETI